MANDDRPPRFTIVLPTHNRADVLPFAIRSALWQTDGDFELLIAGDGCTDRTAEVVASFDDRRMRWLDLPKAPGIGYANRNVALRQARGSYIAYLAHDDLWFPDHLERLGSRLDQTGAEFVYSRMLAAAIDGRITPSWHNLEIPSHRAGLWRGEMAITLSSVSHTRACLAKYGYWDEGLLRAGDAALWHRILASADFRNLAFLSEPTLVRFVANWRSTPAHRIRTRLTRWLLGGPLDHVLPDALNLPIHEGETQQETLWRWLAEDPARRVSEMRRAVVQLNDALLWTAGTAAGLAGLRFGLAVGAVLVRLRKGVMWLSSAEARRADRNLRNHTGALEKRRLERAGTKLK